VSFVIVFVIVYAVFGHELADISVMSLLISGTDLYQ